MGDVKVVRPRTAARKPAGDISVGDVRNQTIVGDDVSAQHRVLDVAFTNGGRTKLHTHTTDQVLIIVSGEGLVGTREERHRVGPGDVVFTPAGEPHFHGAADGADMAHWAIVGAGNETTVVE